MSVLNGIELTNHWRSHLRNRCADSLKAQRKYTKMFGEHSPLVSYFEGKAQATKEAVRILEYMVEYQEMFYGDG